MKKKFEYKTMKFIPSGTFSIKFDLKEIDKTLNEMGKEGWELISVQDFSQMGTISYFHYTFKREI